jgi:hypothetical protein
MRMLFDYYDSDRLIICLDTANIDLMQDFFSDRSTTKLLEIQCGLSDDFLTGHARRVGLAGEETPAHALAQLLPTIRADVIFESDQIKDAEFPNHLRIRESATPAENAPALAEFLQVSDETARTLAETPYLFVD